MDPNKILASVLVSLGVVVIIIILGVTGLVPFIESPADCKDGSCERATPTEPVKPDSEPAKPVEQPPAQEIQPSPIPPPAAQPQTAPAPVQPVSQPPAQVITPPPVEEVVEQPKTPAPLPTPAPARQARRGLPEIGYYTFDKAQSSALPSGWKEIRGAWQAVEDAKALAGTGSNVMHQYEIPKESSDAIVISNDSIMKNTKVGVNVRIANRRTNQTAGLVFRFQDPQHYYSAGLDTLNQRVVLFKTIAGTTRVLSYQSTNRVKANEWHYLQATTTGEHIKVTLDENDYISFKDESFTEGRSGLWTSGSTDCYFDNAIVQKMP